MANNTTYLKLFRKMLTWEWYGDTNTTRVFLHILLNAQYQPSRLNGHEIGAGECAFGYRAWAKELGLSVQQVRTAIKHLISTHEITMRTTQQGSIIRLEKWGIWQIEEGGATRKATHDVTNEQHTDNTPSTRYKESKKVKNKELSSYTDKPVPVGYQYRDPETGRIRFNTGRT